MSSVAEIKVASTKTAVEISKAVDNVYSFTASLLLPTTNILAPSFENAMPNGKVSSDATLKEGETKTAVEISKAVDNMYPVIVS